jgi:hypothetical protein
MLRYRLSVLRVQPTEVRGCICERVLPQIYTDGKHKLWLTHSAYTFTHAAIIDPPLTDFNTHKLWENMGRMLLNI